MSPISPAATGTGQLRTMMGNPMHAIQILTLLLALSGALNTAFATGITARLARASLGQAILTGAGAAGTVIAIFLAAVSAYR
jgi:hypothetical protein